MVDHDPELGLQLMQVIYDHYRASRVSPIHPVTLSEISQLDQTLLEFSKGTRIGKLILSFQNHDLLVRMDIRTSPGGMLCHHW